MIALAKQTDSLDAGTVQGKPLARFLQLARNIHARFSKEEDERIAVIRAAEQRAALKNEVIMRAVNEVLEFCELLRKAPALTEALDQKTEDITQRWFSEKCSYTVIDETIEVKYQAPVYRVDMHMPEHISLTGADDAFLHISFNPIKFVVVNNQCEDESTITKHLLVKQYRLDANGKFMQFQDRSGKAADPIADILTELRAKFGREFFEQALLPYLEAQSGGDVTA